MKTKIKMAIIALATIATLIFLGSCKKKTVEPTPVQTTQTQQLDTNYVTIQVKWSAPAGSSMWYYNVTNFETVSTRDTFQYKIKTGETLMVQLNTNTNISSQLSFTFCALSNKQNRDTIIYQVKTQFCSVLEEGYNFQ